MKTRDYTQNPDLGVNERNGDLSPVDGKKTSGPARRCGEKQSLRLRIHDPN
jgi:hypothetical protein